MTTILLLASGFIVGWTLTYNPIRLRRIEARLAAIEAALADEEPADEDEWWREGISWPSPGNDHNG